MRDLRHRFFGLAPSTWIAMAALGCLIIGGGSLPSADEQDVRGEAATEITRKLPLMTDLLPAGEKRASDGAVAMSGSGTVATAVTADSGPLVRISPDLRAQLASQGSADAIVVLHAPLAGVDLAARKGTVARVQDEVLQRFLPGELKDLYRFLAIPALSMRLDTGQLARFEASPLVRAVGPNRRGTGGLSQSVQLINGHLAAKAGLTGAGIKVAVLDTGVDNYHPDLAGAVVDEACFCQGSFTGDFNGCCPNAWEFAYGSGSAQDDHGHGSNVTGIILSRGTGEFLSPGVAPAAQVVAVKVLDSNNSGWLLDWSKGLDWVLANHPDVAAVNMSLQSTAHYSSACDETDAVNLAMSEAITELKDLNALTVAIAGNYAQVGQIVSPGCISDALAVGAVYDFDGGGYNFGSCSDTSSAPDQVTCFSNTSDMVDILAPGCRVISGSIGGFVSYCGTSMAAPHVAGAIALLRGHTFLGPGAIISRLTDNGVPVLDPRNSITFPRLDVAAALVDMDDDGTDNDADNCPTVANASQANSDTDPLGDVCDNCPLVENAGQEDLDHDRIGDACDPSSTTFPPEMLFVVDDYAGGTIYQLDRGTGAIVNFFPTPEPLGGYGAGLAYSSRRASLFFTDSAVTTPTVYELDPVTGVTRNSFLQTGIDALNGIEGLGASRGGLISVSVQTSVASELMASPYDGRRAITGFTLGNDLVGQGATASQDQPVSMDDHSGWLTWALSSGVPEPAVPVNQMWLVELSSAVIPEVYLTPTRCVAPGGDGVLDTAPAGDDQIFFQEIHVGPDGLCQTLVPSDDDLAGCISAGSNGVVDTPVAGDDILAAPVIGPGPNGACNTTTPAGDDITGGFQNRRINGVGSAGDVLIVSSPDVDHLYVLDALAPPATSPRSGPVILQAWADPTFGGPIQAVAAAPTDVDFDGVINDEDNCLAVANGDQADGDQDKVGDDCDNCPLDPNPDQANFDGDAEGDVCDLDDDNDGVGDGSDCAAFDAGLWAPPGSLAIDMTVGYWGSGGPAAVRLQWSDLASATGPSTVYDVIRGSLTDFIGGQPPGSEFAGAACHADDETSLTTTHNEMPVPAPGTYYLIRGQNDCGTGEYGRGLESGGGETPRNVTGGCS